LVQDETTEVLTAPCTLRRWRHHASPGGRGTQRGPGHKTGISLFASSLGGSMTGLGFALAVARMSPLTVVKGAEHT
jgi:hypothetical protein